MDHKQEEQIKLEHATLLEEYKLIRENVLEEVKQARQMVSLTISAAGIFIAASTWIIQANLFILFLVIPLIFNALALTQLRYLYIDRLLSQYQLDVLIPRLRLVIKMISPETAKSYESVLSWENYFNQSERKHLALLPLSVGNLGVSLLAIILSIIAYFILSGQYINTMPVLELLLLAANTLAFIYIVSLAAWMRFPRIKKETPQSLRRHAS